MHNISCLLASAYNPGVNNTIVHLPSFSPFSVHNNSPFNLLKWGSIPSPGSLVIVIMPPKLNHLSTEGCYLSGNSAVNLLFSCVKLSVHRAVCGGWAVMLLDCCEFKPSTDRKTFLYFNIFLHQSTQLMLTTSSWWALENWHIVRLKSTNREEIQIA